MRLHGIIEPAGLTLTVLGLDTWLGTVETARPIRPGADCRISVRVSENLYVSFGVQILYSRRLLGSDTERFISGFRFHYDQADSLQELTTLLRKAS